MSKQKYRLQYEVGGRSEHEYIEAGSMRAAIAKSYQSDIPHLGIVSVSLARESAAPNVSQNAVGGYAADLPEGVLITAWTLEQLNSALERLGYKPVRQTSNMLNPNAKKFFIDADTPSYCDPGCEAYHSM